MVRAEAAWTTTQITLRRGQPRLGHHPVRIMAARVFEDLEVVSRATCSRDVELLSACSPLVMAPSARAGDFVLLAGIRTWQAALGVTRDPATRMRLRALIIPTAHHSQQLAAELLALDVGTRIASRRGAIGHAIWNAVICRADVAKRGALSAVATRIGTSRQAIWAARPPSSRHGDSRADDRVRQRPQARGARPVARRTP
jgi:hypothetical protein